MGTPGMDLISLGLVDAPKYQLTVEDGRTLAKEYSRVLMRKHRARQAAETTLLRFNKEAIEALPDQLKAAALFLISRLIGSWLHSHRLLKDTLTRLTRPPRRSLDDHAKDRCRRLSQLGTTTVWYFGMDRSYF